MWPDIVYQRFQLIVSDLDGTLKNINAPLDPGLVNSIRKLEENDILFTIATGKNLKSSSDIIQKLGIKVPMIFSNGCVLQKSDGTILEKHVLPAGFVELLIEICDAEKIDLAIHIGEDIYVQRITYNTSLLFDYGSPGLEEVNDWSNISNLLDQAHKCIAIDRKSRQCLFDIERKVLEKVGSSVEYCHTLVEMLEFMPKGVSKLSAVRTLANNLDISLDSIIAIGDGNNDIGMLREAGLGIAVDSAPRVVQEAANWVIPSCAENGPKDFLTHLLEMRIQS